jgi:hypothetical protein
MTVSEICAIAAVGKVSAPTARDADITNAATGVLIMVLRLTGYRIASHNSAAWNCARPMATMQYQA